MAVPEIWIGSVVIDTANLARMVPFWREALHYVPREAPEVDGVVLKDPTGVGPNLSLCRTEDGPLRDYRLHLDLYTPEPEREVDRLVRLGATVQSRRSPGQDFVTLADPDGNLFDVID